MVMKDILQEKRKLKHPQIRTWVHSKAGGDDTYYAAQGTKKNLQIAKKMKAKVYKGDYYEAPLVAYKGKEYSVSGFLKKHPKYKPKKRG